MILQNSFDRQEARLMKRYFIVLMVLLTVLIIGTMTGCNTEITPITPDPVSEPYQFRSDELENYVIIYAENNPDYATLANQLADHIFQKYDKFLTIACDTDIPPAKYEILLGDTNRDDFQCRIMEYSVTVDEGKFVIHAGGLFSAEKAVSYLFEHVFTGQEISLDKGEYYQTSFLTKSQAVTEGSSARIMTANVLADAFADSSYHKAPYRAEIFAGMLISYTPDVLGLQETDESWNNILDTYLEKIEKLYGISYARHLATYQDKVNYTSLLYRSDKFKVENSGVNVFNWWNDASFYHNYHMRNISWAQFSPLENTNETFIVANTHWSYRTEHSDGSTYLAGSNIPIAVNELREQCKDETDAFLSALRQTHLEIPIILTGDFNTSLSFFTDSGWTPTAFEVISEEAKSSNKAISNVPTSGHFDHLFGAGNYTIHLYGFFSDANEHKSLTDHPFAYVDLSF